MRTKAIIFDLDDTLIDTKKRHFEIVVEFLKARGKVLGFNEYQNLRKKNNWSNKQLIDNLYSLGDEFSIFWRLNIENAEYLKYDVEIVNTQLLSKIKAKDSYDFILLSLRSNFKTAEDQFKRFCFSSLIDKYYFLKHSDLNPKIEELKRLHEIYPQLFFIGDSNMDCDAAKKAGVDFVGVQTGIYDITCQPIFDNINDFLIKHNDYAY